MTGFNNGLGPWGPGFYSSKAWRWWAKIPILALVKVSEQQQRVPSDGLLKPQVKSTVWGAELQQCGHSNRGSEPWLGPRVRNRGAALWFFCSLSHVQLTVQSSEQQATRQASLSFIISQSLVKLMSIELRMPSNHLILCHPLLILPSIFPSIRIFSNELAPHLRWPKYWSFNFSISPSNEYSGSIAFRNDWFNLLAIEGISRVFSSTIVWKHQFEGTQPSLWSNSHICTWRLEKP